MARMTACGRCNAVEVMKSWRERRTEAGHSRLMKTEEKSFHRE